jgi:uncharacterized protein YqgC (DUF456 family)
MAVVRSGHSNDVDMSDTELAVTVLCGAAIIVGIFGTVVPFVPGLLLSWGGVLVWAILADRGPDKWIVFGIVTVLALLGTLLKYLLPGRRMRRGGVPMPILIAGAALGIVGFFVVPIVGLFLGFVLGVFLAELVRLRDASLAWPSTWKAMKAVGMSMVIEIFAGLCILATWVGGLLLT